MYSVGDFVNVDTTSTHEQGKVEERYAGGYYGVRVLSGEVVYATEGCLKPLTGLDLVNTRNAMEAGPAVMEDEEVMDEGTGDTGIDDEEDIPEEDDVYEEPEDETEEEQDSSEEPDRFYAASTRRLKFVAVYNGRPCYVVCVRAVVNPSGQPRLVCDLENIYTGELEEDVPMDFGMSGFIPYSDPTK